MIETVLGRLRAVEADDALIGLYFEAHRNAPPRLGARDDHRPVFTALRRQLDEYLAGTRRTFELPLAPRGTTRQHAVWAALQEIPFGEVRSYGALARSIGAPGAARAVGTANARNPLSIVIPCHRVIGSDGSLTGYAGGLEAKRWLLEHEARRA
jgi:methylated-DNA-[protein]-cysteine S-methyltransferase